ncbi:MAG: hypothetical protein H6716_24940 [Polyangiaceae bacterium]|nr:hypothetical protein [Polyangiaceae bacterium]
MAIPKSDYENDRVGGALLMACVQLDYVRELVDEQAAPAAIEHAIDTALETIEVGREMIRGESVGRERKDETLGWMDNYEAELKGYRPAASTH